LALRRECVQLRHLLDNITDAVATEDLQGKIVFANRAFHRLFGVPPGRSCCRRPALIHPDDQAPGGGIFGVVWKIGEPSRASVSGWRSVALELEAQMKPLELGESWSGNVGDPQSGPPTPD
jgi:PAS domain-containing protein